MLENYCQKAQLKDGMDILDLGCGTFVSYDLKRGCLTPSNRVGQSHHIFGAGTSLPSDSNAISLTTHHLEIPSIAHRRLVQLCNTKSVH